MCCAASVAMIYLAMIIIMIASLHALTVYISYNIYIVTWLYMCVASLHAYPSIL